MYCKYSDYNHQINLLSFLEFSFLFVQVNLVEYETLFTYYLHGDCRLSVFSRISDRTEILLKSTLL
jgi:hypothetical protein